MQTLPPDPLDDLPGCVKQVEDWCFQRTGDPHLAADIAQETALQALERLASVRHPARLRGFCFRIAQRRLVDAVRRPRAFPLTREPSAPSPSPPEDVHADILWVREALARLPAILRKPLRLYYMQGRPLRDVARALHTSVNGIKTRLYRARKALKEVPP